MSDGYSTSSEEMRDSVKLAEEKAAMERQRREEHAIRERELERSRSPTVDSYLFIRNPKTKAKTVEQHATRLVYLLSAPTWVEEGLKSACEDFNTALAQEKYNNPNAKSGRDYLRAAHIRQDIKLYIDIFN
jgi:hypothetical protein